jgi:hypothetical protein
MLAAVVPRRQQVSDSADTCLVPHPSPTPTNPNPTQPYPTLYTGHLISSPGAENGGHGDVPAAKGKEGKPAGDG